MYLIFYCCLSLNKFIKKNNLKANCRFTCVELKLYLPSKAFGGIKTHTLRFSGYS